MSDYRKHKKPRRKKKRPRKFKLDLPPMVTHIIGIDEVGWGAGAGPVVVAGVVLPATFKDARIKDSKKYTTTKSRLAGATLAKEAALDWTVEYISIDALLTCGPSLSLQQAQYIVAVKLYEKYPNSIVIVDGNRTIKGLQHLQRAVVAADSKVCAVSCASIIAKVARDEHMCSLGEIYPEWEWHKNKGYLTQEHTIRIKEFGPTKHHRQNIKLIKEALESKGFYEESRQDQAW